MAPGCRESGASKLALSLERWLSQYCKWKVLSYPLVQVLALLAKKSEALDTRAVRASTRSKRVLTKTSRKRLESSFFLAALDFVGSSLRRFRVCVCPAVIDRVMAPIQHAVVYTLSLPLLLLTLARLDCIVRRGDLKTFAHCDNNKLGNKWIFGFSSAQKNH